MEKKIASLRSVRYEKQYKEFYSSVTNRQMSLSCFFKADVVNKNTKIS
jgi:hypothetical protein